MKTFNLFLLSDQDRRNIELSRMAALLIHKMKRGIVTRSKVSSELSSLDISEQEIFKDFLNKYKAMR